MRFPSIATIAAQLVQINKECEGEALDSDDTSVDVRLQVYPDGQWAIRVGDSQYDQDHNGYWGSASVPGGRKRFHSREVARDLIEQAKDMKATGEL